MLVALERRLAPGGGCLGCSGGSRGAGGAPLQPDTQTSGRLEGAANDWIDDTSTFERRGQSGADSRSFGGEPRRRAALSQLGSDLSVGANVAGRV